LVTKFPAYMRPDRIINLDVFPENANGKINVDALIEKYFHTFKTILSEENDSEILNKLRQIEMFSSLNGNYGFIEQGGDSIIGLRLIGKLKKWGYQAEIHKLLNAATLNDFLMELSLSENRNSVSHKTELTPIQQWFLTDFDGNKNHYNQSVLLEVLLPIESTVLVNAIHQTLQNFKLLSKIYSEDWQEGIAPKTEFFKCENEDEVTEKCSIIQESFDLKTGPVAGSAVFELDNKKLFFISIHHFYCDGYSWRLILDELQQVLQSRGSEHTSNEVFGKVYQRFLDLGNETQLSDKTHFGESIFNPFSTWKAVDFKTSSYVEWEWDEPETRWFQFNDQIGKSTNEKFLYLFVKTWQSLELPQSSFFFETHGRSYDGIPEITEAIGWFTQFYPVFTTRFPNEENLINVISEEFKNLPNNGLTYMAMENWSKPPFPVLLNFLGNFDEESSSIVRSSKISQGKMTDDANRMLSFVELNAMIFEGKLKWMLRTHPDFDCSSFMETFNSMTKEVINGENTISIVSDQIDQDDLDAINDLLGGM
ncbi:MAG: condensation domain-containing protein, partial [Bacteroidota bacterium]